MSFLHFKDMAPAPGKVTRNVWVHSASSGSVLGWVRWWSPWRRYVFHAAQGIVMDPACLRELADFIQKATDDHKEAQRARKRAEGAEG